MRNNSISKYFAMLTIGCMLAGCGKDDDPQMTPGGRDPRSPVISPIADQVISLPQTKTTLDGSHNLSVNTSSSINSWRWNVIEKAAGNTTLVIARGRSATTDVTGFTEGSYKFTLEITNSLGLISSDTIGVTVLPDSLKGQTRVYEGLTWTLFYDDWDGEYAGLSIPDNAPFLFRNTSNLELKVLDENNQLWFEENSFYTVINDWVGLEIRKFTNYQSLIGKKAKIQVTFQ